MQTFNSRQVCEITGTTLKQLVHWDVKGLVKPSAGPASGRGSRRLYSYEDLVALQAVKRLRDLEVSLQRIQKCVSYLRKRLTHISRPLTSCTLLTDGQEVHLTEDEETLRALVRKAGQKAWVELSIAAIDRELRNRILGVRRPQVQTLVLGDYAYQVQIEPDEDGGYVAEVAGLPGCITQGETVNEVMENAADAIRTYLEAVEDLAERGVALPVRRRRAARSVCV